MIVSCFLLLDGYIETSVANFGLIPYGHSVVGSLYFDPNNPYGCDKFANMKSGEKQESPIIIVRRGKCSFTMKVREIEHAGGKLGVIVDEVNNEAMDQIIMVDDGTGSGIRIPSVMINQKEGEIILSFIENATEAEKKQISIVATFNIAKPSDHVKYDLWVSSSNERGLDFVKDFRHYNDLLGQKVSVTPRYFTWSCLSCDQSIID